MENNNVNPITGEPRVTTNINPITGDSRVTSRRGKKPAVGVDTSMVFNRTQGTGPNDTLASYRKYDVTLSPFLDLDEERAKRQSTAEKWGRGLLKAGVTTVGAVADNTIGVLSGIGEAIWHQDGTKLFNNSVGKSVDKINNWMSENYANYYTEAERNAEGLASLGYANFWADKVTNGIGYAVGSIATVALTGGAGAATRGLSALSKSAKAYKAAKAISTGTKAADALRKTARTGRALNAVRTAEIGMMMSYGESAVEAREVLNRSTETLKQQRADELGIPVHQLSGEDLAAIKDEAASAANVAFGLNMAILSATNLVTFGKMLLPKYAQMRPKAAGIGMGYKKGVYRDFWKESPFWGGVVDKYVKGNVKSGISEAFQEGSQFLIQESADRVIEKPGQGNFIEDWTEAIVEGYGDVYGTKEGKESMMLGAIVGMLMGGFGSVKQYMSETEATAKEREAVVNSLNNPSFNQLLKNAKDGKRSIRAAERMNAAIEQGDHKAYRDAQRDLMMSEIALHERNGTLDMFLERVDDAALMEDVEFAQAFGIPQGAKFSKSDIVRGVKDTVKKYQKLREEVDAAFPSQSVQGVGRAFMSKAEKEQEEERLQEERLLKDVVVRHGMTLEDADGRIEQLMNELNENKTSSQLTKEELSEVGPVFEEFNVEGSDLSTSVLGGQLSQPTIDKLNALIAEEKNPQKRAILIEKARDLQRLARDRQLSIGALNELYGSPEERSSRLITEQEKESARLRQEVDTQFRKKVADTTTYKELEDLMKADNSKLSPEVRTEVRKEKEKRRKKHDKLVREFRKLPIDELDSKLKESTDPIEKDALKEAIVKNRETGQEQGKKEAEVKPTSVEEMEEKQEAEKLAREQAKQDAEAVHTAERDVELGQQADVTPEVEEVEEEDQAEEQEKPKEKPKQEPAHFLAYGEYDIIQDSITDQFFIRVRPGGVIRETGRDSAYTRAFDQKIDRTAHLEDLRDKQVEYRLLPATKDDNGKVLPQAVGVFLGDRLIGVLRGGMSKGSEAGVVRELLLRGKKVTATITQQIFPNVANTGEQNQEGDIDRVFRTAAEAKVSEMQGFVGYAIKRRSEFSMGLLNEEDSDKADALGTLNDRFDKFGGIGAGMVVAVFRTPTGEIKPLPVSTNVVGSAGMESLMQMLRNNASLAEIKELYGIQFAPDEDTKFIIEELQDGKKLISFQVKVLNGKPYTVSYNQEEFLKMMEGSPDAKFTHGTFVEELVDDELVTRFEKGEELTEFERSEIQNKAREAAADAMRRLRMQVDRVALNSPTEMKRLEKDALKVDFIASRQNNSPFINVQIGLNSKISDPKKEQQVADPVSVPVEPESTPTSERKESAEEVAAPVKVSGADLFGAPAEKEAAGPVEERLYEQTDKKGRTSTYYAQTETKENGDSTTTFVFNRSDKDASQRSRGSVPLETALERQGLRLATEEEVGTDAFTAEEGSAIVGVRKIKIVDLGEGRGMSYVAEVIKRPVDENGNFIGKGTFEGQVMLRPVGGTTQQSPSPTTKVISGGQTGIDQLGLEIAQELGLETGGTAPKGFRTEAGENADLGSKFGLEEADTRDYPTRTRINVENSDATVYFSSSISAGLGATERAAEVANKPFIFNPTPKELREFLAKNNVQVLNVAGNRGTKASPKLIAYATNALREALGVQERGEEGTLTSEKPFAFRLAPDAKRRINEQKALRYLTKLAGRDAVSVFSTMKTIGDNVVHGYTTNGAVHLWNNAEIGTEYHEGFHLFFRSMLNDEQRTGLYEDAAEKYGEPTAEEIEAARRGQPEMSNKEARLLALEERMAEEFRGYMLNEEEVSRTLPQRILKFFKDLMAYIKAVVNGGVTVDQAFSLLQNTRVPRSFKRGASQFSPGDAFMLKQYALNPQMHKELIDIAVYKARNSFAAGSNTQNLMGEVTSKSDSEIRNWFLRHSIQKADGSVLPFGEFVEFKKAYDKFLETGDNSALIEVGQKYGLKAGSPKRDQQGQPLPAQMQNPDAADHFRGVYDNWYDVEGELGGTALRGFRSEIVDRLRPHGIKVIDATVEKKEATDTDEFTRIFGISRMQEDPAKKLNEKAKRALSAIPVSNTDGSFFGFQTYVPITDIFTEIAGSVYNSRNMTEMLTRLKVRSENIGYLRDVYNFVNNLSEQEKALFYSSMAMTMNDFRMIVRETNEEGEVTTKILNPAAVSVEEFYYDKWRTESRGPQGMYSISMVDGSPETTINENKKKKAIALLEAALNNLTAPTQVEYNALANGLWEMGVKLGATKEEARARVAQTFDNSGNAWGRFMGESEGRGAFIAQLVKDLKQDKDVFTESAGRIKRVADVITKNFVAPPAMSFVNAEGSVVFPLNQKTDLSITKEMIADGEYGSMMEGSFGHTAGEVRTIATKLVQNSNYQSEFAPIDFDGVKQIDAEGKTDVATYETMTFEDSLAVSLIMFDNQGNKNIGYIAMDTPADRNRLTFIPVPNWLRGGTSVRVKYGLDYGGSTEERIRNVLRENILVDLYRINNDLASDQTLKGYHTNEQFRNLQTGGRLEQDSIAEEAAKHIDQGQDVIENKELREFVEGEIDATLARLAGYTAEIREKLGPRYKEWIASQVPSAKGKEDQFLKDWVVSDMVGRMVSRQIFRSGINYTKDGADYNKRASLTTTPGIVLKMRGEGQYGMMDTFNEITVDDVIKSIPQEDLDAFREAMVGRGVSEEDADRMLGAYKDIETTDAQAFISLEMYRSIAQGMGLWGPKNDEQYDEYLKTGVYNGTIKPLKPSYEFRVKHQGNLVPISHKNSYMVLTPGLVEDIPALSNLLDRMEAKGEFAGLKKVHVVNTVQAKKLGTFVPINPTDVNALKNVEVMELDSRGLKFPQLIPDKNQIDMTLGRQPRKNMIANLRSDKTYTFMGKEVPGDQLIEMYQDALVTKLELNKQRVFEELGYDKVLSAPDYTSKMAAIEQMLPKLRDKMKALAVEKDYTQNFLDALEITRDEKGRLTTRMPLSFAPMQSKLDQLLNGLFRTEVYQMKLAGQEMVQFAEFGPVVEEVEGETEGETETKEEPLKFYSIEETEDGSRIVEAEVDIHPAVLERMGVDISKPIEEINKEVDRLLGYRIPQQGKSSMMVMRIRRLLDDTAKGSVRVPTGTTAMMGSDFDIDKMFVIFPELENGKRVVPSGPISEMSEKQLNNVIFETFAAVGTSVEHLDEILGGVEIVDLQRARARLYGEYNEETGEWEGGKPVIDINNPAQRVQTGVDNMLSGVLRGAYANAIAGRNVALASNVLFQSSDNSEIKIKSEGRTYTLNALVDKSPITGKYTDQYMSQYLSGAVDSVKDPLQEQINDNAYTSDLTVYMLSMGMTPLQIAAFLNIPVVRGYVDTARAEGETLRKVVGRSREYSQTPTAVNLDENELIALARGEKTQYDEQLYTNMLGTMLDEAGKLSRLYRMLTPDAIDKAGTTPQHLALLDSTDNMTDTFGGPLALSLITEGEAYPIAKAYYKAIRQSLDVGKTLGFISNQPSVEAFKSFIKAEMEHDRPLNEKQHRDINRAVSHYLLTKPGSPFFESGLLDASRVETLHFKFQGYDLRNIDKVLEDAKEINGSKINTVLDSLEVVEEVLNDRSFVYLRVDPTKVKTKEQKEIWTATFEGMMQKPEYKEITEAIVTNMIVTTGFAPGPYGAFDLIPLSMYESVGDIKSHLNEEVAKLYKADYLQEFAEEFISSYGAHRMGGDTFVKSKTYIKQPGDFKRAMKNGLTTKARDRQELIEKKFPKYKIVSHGKQQVLFRLNYEMLRYLPVQTKGKQYLFYEANLRGSDGAKYPGSLLNPKNPTPPVGRAPSPDVVGPSKDELEVMQLLENRFNPERRAQAQESLREAESGERGISKAEDEAVRQALEGMMPPTEAFETLEEYEAEVARVKASKEYQDLQKKLSKDLKFGRREKPAGAQAKIKRLTEAFAAAGIEVGVVQGELPAGVKGQVQGNAITIDPNQITEDTVYHEFGHILVDLLPEADVKKYIQQVVKASPKLARSVKAEYPELDGLELGKEILVTAIGIEGAKLERKNPSKLQRLVNKILRAIGKLFGVQPNAAAMLAEQMFGAEIKAEQMVGKFNPKLQNSRDLRADMSEVTESTLKSLKRQELRLKSLPESEMTKERLREIRTLERNILKIQKREQELESFFDFSDFVFARTQELEMRMLKAEIASKNPELTRAQKLELMNEIGDIKQSLDSLFNRETDKSTTHKMRKLLLKSDIEGAAEEDVQKLKSDLADSLARLEDLNDQYAEILIPVTADILTTYDNTDLDGEIEKEVARLRETKDITNFTKRAFYNKDPKHIELRRKLKNGEISEEEFRDQALELKIETVKNRRPGREQLIQEMTEAHTSKGWFSHYMDPMVYSNEQNLQLFALAIKDALNNATENTRDFLFELEERYSELKAFKGSDFNEEQFNEDFLTTVEIDGVKMLSLVTKYDNQSFYENFNNFKSEIDEKFGPIPTDRSELIKWRKSPKGKAHRRAIRKWYKENTVPKGGFEAAEAKRLELATEIEVVSQKIEQEEDRDRKNMLYTERDQLREEYFSNYALDGTFMGKLAEPNDSYLSDKYKKIDNTPELKEYYDFIVERYAQAQKKIGKSQLFIHPWDEMSYIMPSVRKDGLATLQQEGWKGLIEEQVRDFSRLDTDTQFGVMTTEDGERVKSIPRFYTNRVDAKDVSRDIAASMAQFTHMANMFEEKAKTVGLVNAMVDIHAKRKTIPTDKTGMPLLDQISKLARGVTEGVVKESPENNRAYQHLVEYVDSVFYGQFDLEQGSFLGADISKLAGKAAGLTAVTNLAFNTLQVGNQFILDNLMGAEEGIAGQFYSKSNVAYAGRTYMAEKGALSDLGAFVPKSKLGQAMQMFDALVEVTDNIGDKVTGSKLKKAIQNDNFFALQHAVEHETSAVRMLALLDSYKGKLKDADGNVILTEDGKEANLYDLLIKDVKGKYMIDPRVANVTRSQVIARLHGINKKANQIKGSQDRSMGQRRALGKLLLLFRNYFTPGYRKRFGHNEQYHVDHEVGDFTKGMYTSLMNYFTLAVLEGQGPSVYQMMSETDRQNLRRSMYEAALALTTWLVYTTLNAAMEDDDDDDYITAFTAYQARRLQTELLQFVSPGEFIRMVKSPMATVNWIEKYMNLGEQILLKEPGYAFGVVDEDDIFYQRRTGSAEKGDRKVLGQLKRALPVLNGYQTSFLRDEGAAAVEEKLRWFN